MIEPIDAGSVAQVVSLVMMTGPLDVVEVLHDESERILHVDRRADTARRARRTTANLAVPISVEQRRGGRGPPEFARERETRTRRLDSSAEDEAVMDELFVAA